MGAAVVVHTAIALTLAVAAVAFSVGMVEMLVDTTAVAVVASVEMVEMDTPARGE